VVVELGVGIPHEPVSNVHHCVIKNAVDPVLPLPFHHRDPMPPMVGGHLGWKGVACTISIANDRQNGSALCCSPQKTIVLYHILFYAFNLVASMSQPKHFNPPSILARLICFEPMSTTINVSSQLRSAGQTHILVITISV
jgi:hypothetical protein